MQSLYTGRKTIQIIDSDANSVELARIALEFEGFQVISIFCGSEELKSLYQKPADMILIDVALPAIDGWGICRNIRAAGDTPIIIVTSLDSLGDRLKGLGLGADDYIVKPFDPQELVARVKAVLRRSDTSGNQEETVLKIGDFDVDFLSQEVSVRGSKVNLTPKEFRLLSCLIKNRGQVVSPKQLLIHVWGPQYDTEVSYVKLYIRYLRSKIEADPAKPRYVVTERKLGYRFTVPLE